jgi:hypothetical protein
MNADSPVEVVDCRGGLQPRGDIPLHADFVIDELLRHGDGEPGVSELNWSPALGRYEML